LVFRGVNSAGQEHPFGQILHSSGLHFRWHRGCASRWACFPNFPSCQNAARPREPDVVPHPCQAASPQIPLPDGIHKPREAEVCMAFCARVWQLIEIDRGLAPLCHWRARPSTSSTTPTLQHNGVRYCSRKHEVVPGDHLADGMYHRVDRRSPKILGPRPKPHPTEETIIARTRAPWTGDRPDPGTLPREAEGPQGLILR
jgi:hypothetical protein